MLEKRERHRIFTLVIQVGIQNIVERNQQPDAFESRVRTRILE